MDHSDQRLSDLTVLDNCNLESDVEKNNKIKFKFKDVYCSGLTD